MAMALIENGAKIELPIILNGQRRFHPELHFLLGIGMAVAGSKDETLGALKEAPHRGYGMCTHCRTLLSGDKDKFRKSPIKV